MRLIGDLLRMNAIRYPDKTALIMDDAAMTYAELDRRSNALAHALIAMGIKPGDRVALLSMNRLEYPIVTQGVAKTGAILVPLNFRFGAREIKYVLGNSEPVSLFMETSYQAVVEEALADGGLSPRRLLIDAPADNPESMAGIMAGAPMTDPGIDIDPNAPCVIMYTSGTTGFPKGVLVSHNTYYRMYAAHAIEARLTHQEVFLIAVPMFHAAGMNMALHQTFYLGATGIVHRGKFDVDAILGLIQRHRITLVILVPMTVSLLAHHPRLGEYDLTSLDKIFYGSASITPDILNKAREVFPTAKFTQFYGSTEGGMVSVLRSEDHARFSQTSGCQTILSETRIVKDNGEPAKVGETGEVIVRQCSMGMIGYWRNEKATRETIRNGWIYTGDLARVEPEGFLTVVDRRSDLIITGGENVYPREVELVLAEHPAVREVAVFGVPDPLYGQSVRAAVALWPNKEVDEKALIEYTRARIAAYKCPRRVDFHDNLPRNAADKIQKNILRQQAEGR